MGDPSLGAFGSTGAAQTEFVPSETRRGRRPQCSWERRRTARPSWSSGGTSTGCPLRPCCRNGGGPIEQKLQNQVISAKNFQESGAIVFKYDEVPDVTTDYCGGQDCFVGIAAVLNNDTGEYREVMEATKLLSTLSNEQFSACRVNVPHEHIVGSSASIRYDPLPERPPGKSSREGNTEGGSIQAALVAIAVTVAASLTLLLG